MTSVPPIRIRSANDSDINPSGGYVLYWMTGSRRVTWNFALDRAVDHAQELGKPVVILEALRTGYPWASDRIHAFILDGMAEHARLLKDEPVTYYPYLERNENDGRGLLEALAEKACVVITDDFPCFFIPRMIAAAAPRIAVRVEQVDSNGILPMAATDNVFPTAYAFRRFLQKNLRGPLAEAPRSNPFARKKLASARLPAEVKKKWPPATEKELADRGPKFSKLPIDHDVPVCELAGGMGAARKTLATFLGDRLGKYGESRNDPTVEATSGLSPYLHFGHISAHEVFAALAKQEKWNLDKLSSSVAGKREGWWGMSGPAEGFLDEIVTWREVGYNFCSKRSDYDRYESLPDWAQATLAKHENDPREFTYSREQLENARTHDKLWNAAQTQLRREGKIHNYLRMLWGKKILEWSPTPRDALAALIELNNKYALDGRNPNSYSGIFWTLGRYDRAWGPERPIFGTVRFMSSDNTARKYKVKPYLAKYLEPDQPDLFR